MNLIALILSLPTENTTIRMRAWRTLKASGAAILRDGVYLMPERDSCRTILEAIATDVLEGGGKAYVFRIEEPEGANFVALFDRNDDYAGLLADIARAQEALKSDTAPATLKQTRKLRKTFAGLAEIDFFPGEAHKQANAALQNLELAVARMLFPDEPHPVDGEIARLQIDDYQNRTWATRRRPWVDRLASAWLIRRFIDPQARLLWLASPSDCPDNALGFDFDGATFSHVGARVTFEVLLASFGIESAALRRIGALVHYLDIGGVQPPETTGVESILAGLREAIPDDDQLLAAASSVFEGLHSTFEKEVTAL
ncbi:MAG: chromate resistance protein ChrB domain-containing protein [Gallionella sp.]